MARAAGIADGGFQVLRKFPSEPGEPGRNGAPPGDLYVTVRIKEHNYFERMGEHVLCELPISFTQAALGAVALDGSADSGAGGNDTHARHGRGIAGGRAHPPGEQKSSAIKAAALLAHGAEVGVAPQTLPGSQAHG